VKEARIKCRAYHLESNFKGADDIAGGRTWRCYQTGRGGRSLVAWFELGERAESLRFMAMFTRCNVSNRYGRGVVLNVVFED
jgi:hypothetical protein